MQNMLLLIPPLWSSGQSSWLEIRKSRVRFPGTTKKKVVGLERGPLSLVSTTEELLGRNSSGCGLESREYGRRNSSRWPCGTLLALTSLTSGGRSVGIVRLQTEATEFAFMLLFMCDYFNKAYFNLYFIPNTKNLLIACLCWTVIPLWRK
jgi:hypothetical protein